MEEQDKLYLKKYLSEDRYEWGIKLLEKGIPVQYIVGNVDFYGNIINVNKNVLIPRFETELLVDKTIKMIKNKFNKMVDILEIGTGSGCIAISLKKNINSAIDAVDISNEALDVAKQNGILNNCNINFFNSDVFSNIDKKYDVIISNPPYIAYDEKIMDVVYNNEPHVALFASDNGLYFYDKILKECSDYVKDEFIIALEIGYMQAESIKNLAYKYLTDISFFIEKDYSGKDRFVFITNKKE